jgi:hypothetical protein
LKNLKLFSKEEFDEKFLILLLRSYFSTIEAILLSGTLDIG